jgi:hypothetical protein
MPHRENYDCISLDCEQDTVDTVECVPNIPPNVACVVDNFVFGRIPECAHPLSNSPPPPSCVLGRILSDVFANRFDLLFCF